MAKFTNQSDNQLKLLDIIPLEPLLPDSPDSYSYSGVAPVGALVRIPFGRKTTNGIVIGAQPLHSHKLAVKASPYTLKPISGLISTGFIITARQLAFGRWLSNYSNRSLPFIATLLTQFQKKCPDADKTKESRSQSAKPITTLARIVRTLEADLIKTPPVLILVPHQSYCAELAKKFPRAIVVDLSLPPKQFCPLLEQLQQKKKAVFIAAKHSIFLPWQKLRRVIVVDEGSGFYKDNFKPPYFDYIPLIEHFAADHDAELILVDSFPSLRHFIASAERTRVPDADKRRSRSATNPRIISAIISKPTLNFETVATGDLGAITALIRSNARTIVCSPQRLLAQRIRCDACRNDLNCQRCHAAITINEGEMLCRLCGTSYPLLELCPRCQEPLRVWGTGAQWLGRHLRREGITAITINKPSDLARTAVTKSAFTLVGSLALMTPRLPRAELLIFTDFDRAYHAADIFIRERYLRLLHFLARYAQSVVLQTDLAPTLLEQIATGAIIDDILQERQALNLPPYTRLIKLTSRLQDLTKLTERMKAIRKTLEIRNSGIRNFEVLGPFPRKLAKRRSRYQLELALKIDPSVNLRQLLHGLRLEEVEIDAVSMD